MALFRLVCLCALLKETFAAVLRCHVTHSGSVIVAWDAVKDASGYEVQGAVSEHDSPFVALRTSKTFVDFQGLHSGSSFVFRMRHHHAGKRVDEGWSGLSDAVACKAGVASNVTGKVTLRAVEDSTQWSFHVDKFNVAVVREARGDQPDYLAEHNAANFEGESSFLVNHAHKDSLIQLFCVEVIKPPNGIQGQSTTGGHAHFANYASCQKPTTGTAAYKCNTINDADCKWLNLTSQQCSSARSRGSWDYSSRFVGLGVRSTPNGVRELYSFPRATECHVDEQVGDTNSAGSVCTWKMHQEFRLVKGHPGMTAAELLKAFSKAPMTPLSCLGIAPRPGTPRTVVV